MGEDEALRRVMSEAGVQGEIGRSETLGEASGGDGAPAVRTTLDLDDDRSPSIAIEVPPSSVDVTDEFRGNLTG